MCSCSYLSYPTTRVKIKLTGDVMPMEEPTSLPRFFSLWESEYTSCLQEQPAGVGAQESRLEGGRNTGREQSSPWLAKSSWSLFSCLCSPMLLKFFTWIYYIPFVIWEQRWQSWMTTTKKATTCTPGIVLPVTNLLSVSNNHIDKYGYSM